MKKINFVYTLFLLFVSIGMLGQRSLKGIGDEENGVTINGPIAGIVNGSYTYQMTPPPGVTVFSGTWSAVGGIVENQNTTSATIKWTSTGVNEVRYTATSTTSGTLKGVLLVNVATSQVVNAPPNPTIFSQTATNAIIQKTNSIPSGVMWYWQGTNSAGVDMTSPATSNYIATNSGIYYIRARDISTGSWSGLSGYVNVNLSSNSGGNSNNNTTVLSNLNYVHTITPQIAVSQISELTNNEDALKEVTYFDGLGRMSQNVLIKQSASQKDIVKHYQYDNLGRQKREYLPYASTLDDGFFKSDVLTKTNAYYTTNYASDIDANNPNPFSEKEFDDSPLNLVYKQASPGKDWRLGGGHEVELAFDSNTANEVRIYEVSLNGQTPTLTGGSQYYAVGELFKVLVKNENHSGSSKNHTTEEFTNKEGQLILKRTYSDTKINGTNVSEEKHDTYYVYDDYGNLSFVLPPQANANDGMPSGAVLSELCYQYTYDIRRRIIEKKLPGKGREYIVYDNLNRPILTQDANQRTANEWMFSKYDIFGRVIYNGIYIHTTSLDQAAMQSYFDIQNNIPAKLYESKVTSGTGFSGSYYTNNNFPSNNIELLEIKYYDNYSFNLAGATSSVTSYSITSTSKTNGLETGSRVKVLGTNDWITNVVYFDQKARSIYVYAKNDYLNTTDIVKSKLSFSGRLEETTTLHTNTDNTLPTITTIDKYTYDHAGRALKHTQTLAGQIEVISDAAYDELGQLLEKKVGGSTSQNGLQTLNYKYNIRGWLTSVNDTEVSNTAVNLSTGDLFGYRISYNNSTDATKDLFNGNISQMMWKSTSANPSGNAISNKYNYTYDAMNRIKTAYDNTGKYDVYNLFYDKNGNISSLKRDGAINNRATSFGLMDDLTYTYDHNKLIKVEDNAGSLGFNNGADVSVEYTYDANGNLKKDENKEITDIQYNHLNLPTEITFTPPTSLYGGTRKVIFTYDATGIKQSKKVINIAWTGAGPTGATTDTYYAGNYIYKKYVGQGPDVIDGQGQVELQFFSHPEGYVKNDNSTFSYVYQYSDHLGNTRLSYTDTNNNGDISQDEIIEESNYYPFGLLHKGYNNVTTSIGNSSAQKFGFQGQELQDELGLNWSSFKWRNADPALGRFFNIDPLAEEYSYQSPYNFSENRVMDGIELEGLEHLSVQSFDVTKNPNGKGYKAKYKMTGTYKNVGDWKGTRYEEQYNVFDSKGKYVTHIFTGRQASLDLYLAGFKLSSKEFKNPSFSEIWEGAKNNPEFQRAGRTMQNVIAVAGLIFAAPAVAAGEAGIFTYLGAVSDLDTVLGGEKGALSGKITNEQFQNFVQAYNLLTSVAGKNISIDEIVKNGGNVSNIVGLTKSIYGMADSIDSLNKKPQDYWHDESPEEMGYR